MVAIIAEHEIVVNHEAIAKRFGPHCSARAIMERIKKLKKKLAEPADDEAAETTPVKGKGKAGKIAKKDGKSANTGPVAGRTRKAKKGNEEVIIKQKVVTKQEVDKDGHLPEALIQGTKRKYTDIDEDEDEVDADLSEDSGIVTVEKEKHLNALQLDGAFEF